MEESDSRGALYTTSPEKERKDPRVCVCVFAHMRESFNVIKIAVLLESTYKFKTKPNSFLGELNEHLLKSIGKSKEPNLMKPVLTQQAGESWALAQPDVRMYQEAL